MEHLLDAGTPGCMHRWGAGWGPAGSAEDPTGSRAPWCAVWSCTHVSRASVSHGCARSCVSVLSEAAGPGALCWPPLGSAGPTCTPSAQCRASTSSAVVAVLPPRPATLQSWLSMVVSSHESEAIGGSQATAGLRTAFASGPQTPPGCRSTNHGAGRRPEGSQATWSKTGALARPSSTFPVAVGPGRRTGASTGVGRASLSSSIQPPIFAHQPLPVSSEYHSPDSGWWPLPASSPRALCCACLPQSTSASRS